VMETVAECEALLAEVAEELVRGEAHGKGEGEGRELREAEAHALNRAVEVGEGAGERDAESEVEALPLEDAARVSSDDREGEELDAPEGEAPDVAEAAPLPVGGAALELPPPLDSVGEKVTDAHAVGVKLTPPELLPLREGEVDPRPERLGVPLLLTERVSCELELMLLETLGDTVKEPSAVPERLSRMEGVAERGGVGEVELEAEPLVRPEAEAQPEALPPPSVLEALAVPQWLLDPEELAAPVVEAHAVGLAELLLVVEPVASAGVPEGDADAQPLSEGVGLA
jgi:hypothetical protein